MHHAHIRALDYSCFLALNGAILACFGRPSTHSWPVIDHPLEEDEADTVAGPFPYVIGLVVWDQREARR